VPDYRGDPFDPPAPCALVVITHPRGATEARDVEMLIDTGADVTVIPKHIAASLGLERSSRRYDVAGFDGREGTAEAVEATLIVAGRTYRGNFLLGAEPWGILGRNILNTLRITLDGPRLAWRVV
jgi:predicted aspartyl protease